MPLKFFPEPDLNETKARDLTRALLSKQVAPLAIQEDESCFFNREHFNAFAKAGLTAMALPTQYAGQGQSARCHYAVLEEISKVSNAFAVSVAVTNLVQGALLAFGNESQKQHILPKLCKGEWLGAFSLSEPGSGSDAAGLKLKAAKVEGGFKLSGTKCWCSTGGAADIYLVMARTGEHKTRGISSFLIRANTKGFRIGKQEKKLGLKSSPLSELIFEDCFVADSDLLGKEGEGFNVALSQLDLGRIGIGACGVGLSISALERLQSELNGEFGKTCAFKEYASQKASEFYARIQSVKLLITAAATLKDSAQDVRVLAAQIKLLGSDLAMEVCSDVVQILGEKGVRVSESVERYFRDAKALQIVEGTNQIQKLVLAREMEKMCDAI